ncbi:hypothetical protein BD410DRAFT_796040 [Rickenella mellea]|uniref:Uncharacterized protein n=1 Tax=Rickenella mellea TaxID=50990 RepID=A0A4Y7PL41_9AGAM|nr:hypothetical protein BD410DRAFT_796040 [Rickenella mellea]
MDQLSRVLRKEWNTLRRNLQRTFRQLVFRTSQPSSLHHPELTGYRLILITLTTSFGASKAILAYQGRSAAPTTVEWVFGVIIGTTLYWLSLYEDTEANYYRIPWLFEIDYWRPVRGVLRLFILCMTFLIVAITFLVAPLVLGIVYAVDWVSVESVLKFVLTFIPISLSMGLGIGTLGAFGMFLLIPLASAIENTRIKR